MNMLPTKIININSNKGSATLVFTVIMFFIITFVFLAFIDISNKQRSHEISLNQIKTQYNATNIEQTYQNTLKK